MQGIRADRVPEELCMEVRNIVQEAVIKTIPKEKEMQQINMVVWGGLTNGWEKKRSERQRRKGKIHLTECRVPGNSKEGDEEAFLNEQCKEIEENKRMGKTKDLFQKIGDAKGTFYAKMGTIKERNVKDLTEA